MTKYFFGIIIAICLTFLASCGGTNDDKVTDEDVNKLIESEIALDSVMASKGVQQKLDYIIEHLQTSDNLIKKLSANTSIFSDGILNDVAKATEYESAKEKALNLGIYGADLNYLIHFSQTHTSFKYLLASKQLADQIGVAMAFDQKVLDEYQSNSENKDTLLNIVFGAYKDVKKLLKNNEQFQMSTLVLAGSWIENMYIATELVPLTPEDEKRTILLGEIKGQKDYLHKIYELLKILNDENNPYVDEVLGELICIDSVYSSIGENELTVVSIVELNQKIETVRNNLTLNN